MSDRPTMLARLDGAMAIAQLGGRVDLVTACEDKSRTIRGLPFEMLETYALGVDDLVRDATTCTSLRKLREHRAAETPGWDALLQRLAGQEAA